MTHNSRASPLPHLFDPSAPPLIVPSLPARLQGHPQKCKLPCNPPITIIQQSWGPTSHPCLPTPPAPTNHNFPCSSQPSPVLSPHTSLGRWFWGPWLRALVQAMHLSPWECREKQSIGASTFLFLHQCSCTGSWCLQDLCRTVGSGRAWPQPPACSCQTLAIIPCPPCCNQCEGPSLMHPRGLLLALLPAWTWQGQSPSITHCRISLCRDPLAATSCAGELNSTEPPGEGPEASPLPTSRLLPHLYLAHQPLPDQQPLSQNGTLQLGHIPR